MTLGVNKWIMTLSDKIELVSSEELLMGNPMLKYFGGEFLASWLLKIMKLDKVNDFYTANDTLPRFQFIDNLISTIGCSLHIPTEDFKNIPTQGPFITIANHAYGGIDGILLLKIFSEVRPDYKMLVNFLLTKIKPLNSSFIGVNPFETRRGFQSSFGGLKNAIAHLQDCHSVGLFPSGEVSSYKIKQNAVSDREWQYSIIKFIKRSKVPIVPVYFDGHNSFLFNLLGFFHPVLRTVRLPAEVFNKQGKTINIRIGSIISLKEQDEFKDIYAYGCFLRTKVYSLGLSLKTRKMFSEANEKNRETIPCPMEETCLMQEINTIKTKYLLFSNQDYFVFCAPQEKIPSIIKEIGRLREKTYREVGEGTGNDRDIDSYDSYFEQLFVWDNTTRQIVGGYRVGKGKEILEKHGIKGFYIHSLFKISPAFEPLLRVSIELGRSFIVKHYQKRTLPLFFLWKGILYLLLKHPQYRYLIGPVSISNVFLDISKSLTVEFLNANYFNSELGQMIRARHPYKRKLPKEIRKDVFIKHTRNNLSRLDKFIHDFDPSYKTPILVKKYISVNSEVIGFNIDPLFNNCLDALMILDVFEIPYATIESLSKEFNDQAVLERFKNEEYSC